MKSVKNTCLCISIVLFLIGIFLKNTVAQLIVILIGFILFEIWAHLFKKDRNRNGQS